MELVGWMNFHVRFDVIPMFWTQRQSLQRPSRCLLSPVHTNLYHFGYMEVIYIACTYINHYWPNFCQKINNGIIRLISSWMEEIPNCLFCVLPSTVNKLSEIMSLIRKREMKSYLWWQSKYEMLKEWEKGRVTNFIWCLINSVFML